MHHVRLFCADDDLRAPPTRSDRSPVPSVTHAIGDSEDDESDFSEGEAVGATRTSTQAHAPAADVDDLISSLHD